MRFNAEGIRREDLLFALTDGRLVRAARRIPACLLCRRSLVNEAGLCDVCWALLDGSELEEALKWTAGVKQ